MKGDLNRARRPHGAVRFKTGVCLSGRRRPTDVCGLPPALGGARRPPGHPLPVLEGCVRGPLNLVCPPLKESMQPADDPGSTMVKDHTPPSDGG